ncbi:MAG TPA: MBOAT family O-acyltransferase, partial [Pedobacter sp.]|nr:MBOAT family O-acyltransferase [Pedobacter sp.]
SGYTDIAIGTAKLLGFQLATNFNTPYFSKSLTEFWRRWHISLSTWFRDYVYIPLGGNRKSKFRADLNILITFVLSGFWHGAAWTFLVWGALHGSILILEKRLIKIDIEQKNNFQKGLHVILTFSFICLAWVFFRSNSLSDALFILRNMFSDIPQYFDFMTVAVKFRGMGLKPSDLLLLTFFILLLLIIESLKNNDRVRDLFNTNKALRWTSYYFLLIIIIVSATKNPAGNFIYFQF